MSGVLDETPQAWGGGGGGGEEGGTRIWVGLYIFFFLPSWSEGRGH